MSTWVDQYRDSFKSLDELRSFFKDSPIHLEQTPQEFDEKKYPLFIPRAFAEKIKALPPHSALWKQFIPDHLEFKTGGMTDPIGDEVHQKTKQLIHRYKSRALFIPTTICPIHCRYCFRKNELYADDKIFSQDFESSLQYLNDHPEIEELIFTGGDPLILSDKKIENYLKAFSEIKSLQFIRFHSRTPIILPRRLSKSLAELLKKYSDRFHLSLSIHINHLEEWSCELEQRLMDFQFLQLLAQTVLLKDVNDSREALIPLFKKLSRHKIIPYYLHHPDPALGTDHFQLTIQQGRKIYAELRNELSGWMIPEYIIDIPGGYGKTQVFNSEKIEFSGYLLDKDSIKRPVAKRTTL